jgi:hypothetical protein
LSLIFIVTNITRTERYCLPGLRPAQGPEMQSSIS